LITKVGIKLRFILEKRQYTDLNDGGVICLEELKHSDLERVLGFALFREF
jgi:hypothetical protein